MPGPNAPSQWRTSSACARSAGHGSRPPSTQRSIGTQRYRLLSHVPLGRPRMIRPSAASRNSSRVETPTLPAHFLPSPNEICSRSPGTRFVRSAAVASPSSSRASSVSRSTFATHFAASFVMPAPSSIWYVRFRSRAAMSTAVAAWTTPAKAGDTTNIVRRMPRTLTRRAVVVQGALDVAVREVSRACPELHVDRRGIRPVDAGEAVGERSELAASRPASPGGGERRCAADAPRYRSCACAAEDIWRRSRTCARIEPWTSRLCQAPPRAAARAPPPCGRTWPSSTSSGARRTSASRSPSSRCRRS